MRKFIMGFISGALIFSMIGAVALSYIAKPVDFKVLVNGEEFVSDPPALEVEGRTYLPLRAMGDALGVPVNWNEELRQAEVGISTSNESATQENVNTSGYITYKEKPWCPDFGRWIGKTPYVDFAKEEDNAHFYIYKSNGVTMNDIKGYLSIFNSMGYQVGTISSGYACKDANGKVKMGLMIKDDEIYVLVY